MNEQTNERTNEACHCRRPTAINEWSTSASCPARLTVANLEDAAAPRTTDLATIDGRGTGERPSSYVRRSVAVRMQLGRGTRPGRELAQPGRETPTLTGRDTRRGHGGSSSRSRSAINARIHAVSYRTTKEDIVMDMNSRCESSKNIKTCSKNHQEKDVKLEDNNTIEEICPWLTNFNKVIHSCTGSRNYQHLERLLLLYIQNIPSNLAGSTIRFINRINLIKNHINKMLIFFHLYWLDIKQDVADHSQYLNKISALLNVYIDMELKTSMKERTSSHVVRDSSKIAAKILAALYIYLNNSEEHIFRVLLRIKHATKKYKTICNHIFTKSFTNLKTKATSITDVVYIRYLLAFKMWRKMEETTEKSLILPDKKERINKLALMLLGPRMPKLQDELLKFVPRPPMDQENETLWLIQDQFDIKQFHKQFLLFEDKMDNSTGLQCTNTAHADQNCSKSQKHQMKSLFRRGNSNGDASQQKRNKCLSGLRNNNTLPNNENKSLDQTYLQKKGSKSLKSLKKIRKKSRKIKETVIIDLTGDNEIIIPCKIERKRTERDSKCLKVMKNIMRSKKHITPSKYSSKIVNADVKECSIEDNKGLRESAMETIPLFKTCQNNIADQHSFKQELRANCAPTSTNCAMQKSYECCNTMHDIDHRIISNLKSITDHSSQITEMIQQKVYHQDNKCPNCYTKIDRKPLFANNITAAKAQGNLHNTVFNGNENDIKLACDTNIIYTLNDRNKYVYLVNHIDERVMTVHERRVQRLESDDKCIVSTTFTEDQIVEPPSYNQHVNFDNIRMNDYDNVAKYSEATIEGQQKKSDCDSSILNNRLHSLESSTFDINSFDIGSNAEVDYNLKSSPKIESNEITNNYIDDLEHINWLNNVQSEPLLDNFFLFNNGENDAKTFHDENIYMYTADREKCENLTGEHIVTTSAEKRMQYNSKDTCTVSTTSTEDQVVEPPSYNQHVNFDNIRMNDYDNMTKYSEGTIEEQQKRNDCDSSILNRLHSSESSTFDINSFDIGSNAEIDYNLKISPKIEADEITNDYVDGLEHINLLNNVQSEPLLENFFLFNNDENDAKLFHDENTYMCTADREKCENFTGEHIVTTSAEKRMQYNSKDTCTVSTTSTEDQIRESSLNSQHVNSNRRKCDYEDTSKYFEDTIKQQQGRSDCNTLKEQLHSSELCTFDIDFLEIDSKEASKLMKTDCMNDCERISFLHNNQTFEDIFSNGTPNFLPLKQSLFELDNVYTYTSLKNKNVLCNNQNNAIDSSIDLVASHLNADNSLLRLPAKSDKPMFQEAMEFRYSS